MRTRCVCVYLCESRCMAQCRCFENDVLCECDKRQRTSLARFPRNEKRTGRAATGWTAEAVSGGMTYPWAPGAASAAILSVGNGHKCENSNGVYCCKQRRIGQSLRSSTATGHSLQHARNDLSCQDTRRATARPAQSRDIARRPPALLRHAAVPTRTDGMGAVARSATGAAAARAFSRSHQRRQGGGGGDSRARTLSRDSPTRDTAAPAKRQTRVHRQWQVGRISNVIHIQLFIETYKSVLSWMIDYYNKSNRSSFIAPLSK